MICLRLYVRIFPLASSPAEQGLSKVLQTKPATISSCFHLKSSYVSVKQEQADRGIPAILNNGRKSKGISPFADVLTGFFFTRLRSWPVSVL